ncbi:helix-turn-helix domain-containing protein [Streptomyces sp. NPDC050564]|uniref:helix-turn-helix domain-containing protein n=1 Tax=Streptomyces sp. NPDC050564 TaxID=3365631 RepID=UPI0037B6967A
MRWLREQRMAAGLNYTQMARRTECSADTLRRAASGRCMPRRQVVLAYAAACGARTTEAERLWRQARYQQAQTVEPLVEQPKHITYVRDFADLHLALVDLHRKSGSRSCRELEERSDGALSRSTVWRVLNEQTRRPAKPFVMAFAEVCGVRGIALQAWAHAWDRAEERRTGGASRRRREAAYYRITSRQMIRELATMSEQIRAEAGVQEFKVLLDRGRTAGGRDVWRPAIEQPTVPVTRLDELVDGQRLALSPGEWERARRMKRQAQHSGSDRSAARNRVRNAA